MRRGHPRPERRTGYWTARARVVIEAAVQDWLRDHGLGLADLRLVTPADPEYRDLRRYVRGCYPFGDRGGWPYKVWLREVRDGLALLCGGAATPDAAKAAAARKLAAEREAAGQVRLEL